MISCVMIAWNEAQTIDLSLKSISKFVDEVVIADTGSFDGTQSIASEQLDALNLSGEVINVKAKTLGQARLAAWSKCKGSWILLIDSNFVLSNAVKKELKTIQSRATSNTGTPLIGCVRSMNLMGDYNHYFTPLQFHAHHVTFFHKDSVYWKNDEDRPSLNKGVKRVSVKPWAVNLSRVRPAWRSWYRGEPFDPNYFDRRAVGGWRTKTNRQDKWLTEKQHDTLIDYVKAHNGMDLKKVKQVSPDWYLGQLNKYAEKLPENQRRELPEVIKAEIKNPRYKLIYDGKQITGRIPGL